MNNLKKIFFFSLVDISSFIGYYFNYTMTRDFVLSNEKNFIMINNIMIKTKQKEEFN